MTLPIAIRAPEPPDRGLVFSGWKESFAASTWGKRFASPRDYFAVMNVVLDRVVPKCNLFVACLADEPAVAVGWLATLGDRAEYLYVKPRFAADLELRGRIEAELCRHAGVSAPPPWEPTRAIERTKP